MPKPFTTSIRVATVLAQSGNAFDKAILNVGTPAMWIRASETGGSTLADSSGNSRTLSITGTPTFAQAGLGSNTGTSVENDGSTVNFYRNSGGELTRTGGTSYMLARFDSAGEGNVSSPLYFQTGANNSGLWFTAASMTMQLRHEYDNAGYGLYLRNVTTTLSTGVAYHLFWGMDSNGDGRLYYATIGGSVTEVTYSSTPASAAGTDYAYTALGVFSNSSSSRSCDGLMDEFVHWNSVDVATLNKQAIVNAVGAP